MRNTGAAVQTVLRADKGGLMDTCPGTHAAGPPEGLNTGYFFCYNILDSHRSIQLFGGGRMRKISGAALFFRCFFLL